MKLITMLIIALLSIITGTVSAETVNVISRGSVDIKPFACEFVTRSRLVKRVCYDRRERYMLINLRGTYYHYCEIAPETVSSLLGASSMREYFNSNIKGSYDCRTRRVPAYP